MAVLVYHLAVVFRCRLLMVPRECVFWPHVYSPYFFDRCFLLFSFKGRGFKGGGIVCSFAILINVTATEVHGAQE